MNALALSLKRDGIITLRKIAGENVYVFANGEELSIYQLSQKLSNKLHDDLCQSNSVQLSIL